ncbi:period circadian protein isoform X3 [Cotesia glomerata]|uniref:period circadian protein isoform X3 n=1 Tax=Cotesia glomerata TaxID=32391 RepID=UPI001D02B2AA|nr:period circadian protein isoform X3 [Cotesia glomerata]
MSNDNAKVSDSGYTNTNENSQSQRRSGSSLSRNSNRSESSGYCGGHPSNSGTRNEAPPQPINKKKVKEHKKKKSKTTTPVKSASQQTKIGPYTVVSNALDQKLEKSEDVGNVELMDATDLGEPKSDSKFIIPEREIGSHINSLDNIGPNLNDGFYLVVSLIDGIILYSSASLQKVLGYPKDSCIGSLLIDLVHPNNRGLLTEKVAERVFLSSSDIRKENVKEQEISFFCYLRCYTNNVQLVDASNLKNNSSNKFSEAIDNNNYPTSIPTYLPFYMSLRLNKNHSELPDSTHPILMSLTIKSVPVVSAYGADKTITSIASSFTTRHNTNCRLSHVDDEVLYYFGYLPQDMLSQSICDYYHPVDMPIIKEIYKTIIRHCGAAFKSKPYRFNIKNGEYVLLETEWSAFINPWTKKIDFIVGQHRVVRGPVNINIFDDSHRQLSGSMTNKITDKFTEEVLIKSKIIEGEICALLAEKIQTSSTANYDLTIKSKDIASIIENITNDHIKLSLPTSGASVMDLDDRRFSEHESVMVGEISPHHEYGGSKSSSETPPSYNQLNYNEKIERFFKSKPIVKTAYGSDEETFHFNAQSLNTNALKNDSGGSGSGENLSHESINLTSGKDDIFNNNSSLIPTDNFRPMALTKMLLERHNHDMEKLMVQNHKERQSNIKTGNISNNCKNNNNDCYSNYLNVNNNKKNNNNSNNNSDDNNKSVNNNNDNNNNNEMTEEPSSERSEKEKIQDKSRCGKRNGSVIIEAEYIKAFKYSKKAKICPKNGKSLSINKIRFEKSPIDESMTQDDSMIKSIDPENSQPLPLTETLLTKHNKNMEKLMIQKHKDQSSNFKADKSNINLRRKRGVSEEPELNSSLNKACHWNCSVGYSCKNELFKIPKYNKKNKNSVKSNNTAPYMKTKIDKLIINDPRSNLGMWPLIHQNPLRCSGLTQILPIYYLPISQSESDSQNTESQSAQQQHQQQQQEQYQQSSFLSYTPSFSGIYHSTIIGGSAFIPMIYPSLMTQLPNKSNNQLRATFLSKNLSMEQKRPASQATSVKAEPGSIMAMSESSKKLFSPSAHHLPCVSVESINGPNDSSIEDSSDSSFYGSFLNTSTNSSSNREEPAAHTARFLEINALKYAEGETIRRRFAMVNNLKNDTEQYNTEAATPLLPQKSLPWYHGVKMTPEIAYNYQMTPKVLSEVLKTDLQVLKTLKQPLLVNEQLDQLYRDLELGDFGTKLLLDDSNSSNDSKRTNQSNKFNVSSQHKRIRREMKYNKYAMIYEEDAPLPSS